MEVTKFRKRGVLAVVMSLLMVVSMMPVYGAAYAETGSETTVAAVEAEPGATAEVLAADVAAMEAEAEATVTGTAEPGATAEAEAEAEAASAANPDGSAGSLTALALPEISVRVEYTQPEWNLYPGTYPANYDFYPDEGGGEIYINKPNTDPGVVYNVYVTVEGWGETLGKSGSIGEILGRFNVSGQTETPEGIKQLLLGFGVNIGYTSGPTPTEPELYYKVTGRLGDRVYNPEWGWVFRPLTYDPASIRGREPWISAYLLEDQTPLANRVRVETDGSFELYLLKAVIDTLPETEMVEFRSESPYLTHTGALVPANLIKEEGTIELLGEWAGVVTGTISRGHLPADIIYDDTTSYVRIEFTPVNNTSGSEYRAGVFMNAANDPIPFYLSSIPAGEYEVSFVYVEGPSWWSQGAVFQQYAPTPVTVVALEDTEGINTVGWLGDRDHYNIGDIYGPVVVDVNPLGNNQTPTGELAITFNEPIDMAAGGTVRLVGATAHPTYVPLTNGTWSNNAMTYTVAYDGLEAGHVYRVGISDFRDVRRNVMGDDDSRYSLVVQGGEIDRVFEHTDSGISMSGSFTPDAKVNVIQGLAALGASAACNVMREAYEAGLMLSVQDISVEDGRFIGPVTITIPLGWEYNDRTVYVLHCKGGELEKIRATVVNGAVTFQLTSLSPIGIVLPEALNISAANYDFDAETATLTVKTNAGTTEWKNGTNLTPGDIENIVIEDTVTEIGSGAFADCPINEVTFLGSVPPTIAADAFYSAESSGSIAANGAVRYPADSASAYGDILEYFPGEWTQEAFGDMPAPSTYDFFVTAGTGGTVFGTDSGSYEEGYSVSVTATASSDYHFVDWTADGVTLLSDTTNPAAFFMPANDVALTANFAPDVVVPTTYALTVNGGCYFGSGSYAENTVVTIMADDAPSGKVFDRWTGGDGGVFANADSRSTTFIMPANNAAVTATYKDAPVQTILVTKITIAGDVSIGTKDGTAQLVAEVVPQNASNQETTWTSSDRDVATVDASGKVTPKADGAATIRATAQDGSGVYGEIVITITGQSEDEDENGEGDEDGDDDPDDPGEGDDPDEGDDPEGNDDESEDGDNLDGDDDEDPEDPDEGDESGEGEDPEDGDTEGDDSDEGDDPEGDDGSDEGDDEDGVDDNDGDDGDDNADDPEAPDEGDDLEGGDEGDDPDEGDDNSDDEGDDNNGDEGDPDEGDHPTPVPTVYPIHEHFNDYTGSGIAKARVDADYTEFVRLLLDGVEIDPSNYTVASGSTIITLKEDYLKILSNGTHWLVAEFNDGYSENIKLVVNVQGKQIPTSTQSPGTGSNPSGNTSVPRTGDDASLLICLIVLVTFALGIRFMLIWRKTQKPQKI